MNLKGNQITLGELLDDPRSRAVLQQRFGRWLKHPAAGAARSLTLAQAVEMASVWLPRQTVQETLEQLRRL